MNLVFKLHVVRQPGRQDMGDDQPAKLWPEKDAITPLNAFLAPRQLDVNVFQTRSPQTVHDLPWATIFWQHPLPLAGHFAELRHNRHDLTLSNFALWYGARIDSTQIQSTEILEFRRPPILEELASRSPALAPLWKLLKNKPSPGNWLCLCESPDSKWLLTASADNLERYRKVQEARRQPAPFDPGSLHTPLDQLHFFTAQALVGERNFGQAARWTEPLCRDYPDEPWVWLMRADCLLYDRRPDEARHHYLRALELAPRWRVARRGLAFSYRARGDDSTAIMLLNDLLREDPNDVPTLSHLLQLLDAQQPWEHDPDHYVALARRMTGLEPLESRNWNWLGAAFAEAGCYADAQTAFGRAVAIDPESAKYWNNLGYALAMANGSLDEAETACQMALRIDPDLACGWDTLGLTHLRMGNPRRALTEFRKAVELDPDLLPGWQNMARTCRKLGDLAGAARAWERIAELVLPDYLTNRAHSPQGPLGELFGTVDS